MKLLIVEDHKELSALLSAHLERIGFAVDRVFTGRNALHAIAMGDYDALLLDLGLPDMDGMEVLARCQNKGKRILNESEIKVVLVARKLGILWHIVRYTAALV